MKFTYENQGAITYLVCELEPAEQVDSLTLGMLTNNHIPGFAPVLYTEMNGQRYLKYNISAKVTADQFFAGSMNKQRVLTAFRNILAAICSADDYMIELSSFEVDSGRVYLNVSSCEVAMVCVPVITDKNINADLAAFFRKIMFTTQFDNTEDASYITQLITYVNSGPAFTAYGMHDLVGKLLSGAPVEAPVMAPVAAPVVASVAAPAEPVAPVPEMPVAPPVINQAPAAPVINQAPAAPVIQQEPPKAPKASPFDSTISIDDMPAMMAQKQAQPTIQPAPVAPVMPAPRPEAPKPPVQPFVQPAPVQPQQSIKPQPPVRPQQPAVPNAGFAIPGQPMGGGMPMPPAPAAPQKPGKQPKPPKAPKAPKQAPAAEETGEKKISFFGLLSHYSKENAELYKKQKEEAKNKKAAAAPAMPAQKGATPPVNMPGQMPPQQPPMGMPPMGAPMQQQYAQPQFQPQVRPVPVQNSFNETTVLSPAMMGGGETTVLNAGPVRPDPALIRVKTGERISINKPVFRIGKEKSYVDYFIGDNTAISRSHANIHTDNGEYFVEDTNSTNHTYLNGKLINSNEKVKLTNGDKVRLANEDFTFSV